jgi:hypothetical protein
MLPFALTRTSSFVLMPTGTYIIYRTLGKFYFSFYDRKARNLKKEKNEMKIKFSV